MKSTAFLLTLSMVLLSTTALASVPGLINYQGTLTDGGGLALDTTVSMTFSIYTDSIGGSQVWRETQPAVVVTKGLFAVVLGRVTAIEDTAFNDPDRWLGVQVELEPEMQPRQRIAAVGYAFRTAEADTAEYARNAPVADDGDWTFYGDDVCREMGNVGIGLTGPQAKLHLQGEMRFGFAAERFQIQEVTPYDIGGWSDFIQFGGIGIGSDFGFNRQMMTFTDGQGSDNIFTVAVSESAGTVWNANFVIQQNGDIGIGTPVPLEKLQVEGVVYSTTGGFKFPDETVQTTAFVPSSFDSVAYADSSGYADVAGYAPVPDSVAYADSAGTDGDWTISGNGMYSAVSGNVGIGTTTPDYLLHVNGTAGFNDFIYHNEDPDTWLRFRPDQIDLYAGGAQMITAYETAQDVVVINEGNTDVDFQVKSDTGADAFFVRGSDGNVGIGISSPARTLHISDVMRLEPTTEPLSPSEGDIYMDSTTHKLMVYDGTQWQACW